MSIGARIVSARKELGCSQAAFAELVGVSLSSQKRYEKGERYPDTAYLSAISRAGVDVALIFTGEPQHDLRSELMRTHHAIDVIHAFLGFGKGSSATMPEAPSNPLHVLVIAHDPIARKRTEKVL
jgi:transcriptional regulator with XRE-family HTH domain